MGEKSPIYILLLTTINITIIMITFNFASKQFNEIVNILKEHKHIDDISDYQLIELDTDSIKFVSIDPNIEPISIRAEVNVVTCVYFDKVKIIVSFYTGFCEWATMIESTII